MIPLALAALALFACFPAVLCPYRILTNPGTSASYRCVTIVSGLAVAVLACVYTYHYVYAPDENTYVHGWPTPVVVFHRDAPSEPWLDYPCFTILFGLPMNLALFLGAWFLLLWFCNVVIIRTRKRSGQEDP